MHISGHETLRTVVMALAVGCCPQLLFSKTEEVTLTKWQFSRDKQNWQQVNVPHDWAISGPFDKKWDIQITAIKENGEKKATEHTGRSGALPWLGEGFYKTSFTVPKGAKQATIYFDGAMAEPQVYVNGKLAGSWAYGYNAFRIDITPYLIKGTNNISVSLKNLEESNRWYPGAGLYRPVKIQFSDGISIDPWETFFRTTSISGSKAEAKVSTKISAKRLDKNAKIEILLVGKDGSISSKTNAKPKADGTAEAKLLIDTPKLWSPESPNLYQLQIKVTNKGKLLSSWQTKVGIRMVSVDKKNGFMLNGKKRKFKGVCLHHDLGPLGAAVNKAALIRQVRIMKEMGADAIRTSHNMPSTLQMEVCDSMGMMVMAESFDNWKQPKVKNGYGRFYDEWWRKDLHNLIVNHRNHPSIVMWSIGNEIPEQWKTVGAERAREMTEFCHSLDSTRTVTCGADQPDADVKSGFYAAMDVPGFNYRVNKYDSNIDKLPQGFLLGSETASTVSSRGVYKFPAKPLAGKAYDDGQCSSYDLEYCWWSNLPDEDFRIQDDRSWTIGQFVWTGFDYLGEPTPYDAYWPSRSSYFGICDLAGLKKDRFYLYRSVWNNREHTLHILPHWTWHGREGQVTPVFVYTDYPSAELFVNGKSQGRLYKNDSTSLDRYRLRWNNVKYEPGEIKVVAYDDYDKAVMTKCVRTAGEVAKLKLEAEPYTANDDLIFIDVTAVDKDGNLCPDADFEVKVSTSGSTQFKGICNGDATSLESFVEPHMKLFHGKLVVVVSKQQGKATIKATAEKAVGEVAVN